MIAPILALFCAIGTKCKFTAKIAITKRNNHFFFGNNKKRVIFTNFREKSATPAMGTSCHGDRYLAATTERQWLPGTCPLAGGKEKSFTW